jgi:Flp pilus assembly protein TadD
VKSRQQLALTLLIGLGSSLGCKAMPWSSAPSAAPPVASAPNAGQQRYESLSKEFATSKPGGAAAASGAESDNWLVSSWKKSTAAIAAPFATKPNYESNDPVSLSTKTGKIGPTVYIAAGQILENQGKFADAEIKYQAAIKSSPKDLNSLISLARCYDRQGKSVQAIEAYQKAIKVHPKSSLAHNDLGLCYGRQHATDDAVKHLNKAIELQPDNIRYYNNVATVLVEAGRTDEAYQQLARVNSPATAHYNVACLLHSHKKMDLAAKHLQLALQQDGNLAQARELLATMDANRSFQDERVSALPVSMPGSESVNSSAPSPYAVTPSSGVGDAQAHGYGSSAPPPAPHNSFSPWR